MPLACALIVALLASPGPGDARQRARVIEEIVGEAYQRELPVAGQRARGSAAGREGDLPPAAPRRRAEVDREAHGGRLGPLGSIAQMLLWALMIGTLFLCALWLLREMGERTVDLGRRVGDPDDDGDADAPDRGVIARPLGDADELARRGQFGEAIHVLLLRTLGELAARLPERLPAALTSREILVRVRIPEAARDALTELVGAVEISHFGSVAPGEDDFARCRAHFQRFAQAYLGAAR